MAAITTVIPTYQRAQMLRRALHSVLQQTEPDFEVWVYDNCSHDDTEKVVAEVMQRDSRVHYHRHERNIGAVGNFVSGMRQVRTPYFSFLSDDDVLFPEFFATALHGFERHPEAVASICSTLEFTAAGDFVYAPLSRWRRDGLYVPPDGAFAMLFNRHPTWTGMLFRREAIERLGLIDPETGVVCDLDYELRLAARYPIVVDFRPCAAYTSHPATRSSQEDASVIPGYQKMIANVVTDPALATQTQNKLGSRLQSQMCLKLVEIAGKGLVRGRESNTREAAALLRQWPSWWAVAAAFSMLAALCESFPPARRLLQRAERWRLQRRARTSLVSARDERGRPSALLDVSSYKRYLTLGDGTDS